VLHAANKGYGLNGLLVLKKFKRHRKAFKPHQFFQPPHRFFPISTCVHIKLLQFKIGFRIMDRYSKYVSGNLRLMPVFQETLQLVGFPDNRMCIILLHEKIFGTDVQAIRKKSRVICFNSG